MSFHSCGQRKPYANPTWFNSASYLPDSIIATGKLGDEDEDDCIETIENRTVTICL